MQHPLPRRLAVPPFLRDQVDEGQRFRLLTGSFGLLAIGPPVLDRLKIFLVSRGSPFGGLRCRAGLENSVRFLADLREIVGQATRGQFAQPRQFFRTQKESRVVLGQRASAVRRASASGRAGCPP